MTEPATRIKDAGLDVLKAQRDALMSPITILQAQGNLVRTVGGAVLEVVASSATKFTKDVRKESIKVESEAQQEAAKERMEERIEEQQSEFAERAEMRQREQVQAQAARTRRERAGRAPRSRVRV